MTLALKYTRRLLENVGLAITRAETLESLSRDRNEYYRLQRFYEFLMSLTPDAMASAVRMLSNSRGENFQDIFAMLVLESKRDGFFVEFGATDGICGSNSYMLEKFYGWNGILSEPARNWQEGLRRNRSATISQKCVWSVSGKGLPFRQAEDAGFSTLDSFCEADWHAEKRRSGVIYEVETISLNDLLAQNNSPAAVDYLSIDTEGSELDILSNFDFTKWRVSVLTVEHNFRPEREEIFSLMSSYCYVRAPVSASKYDDWYVTKDFEPRLAAIFAS